MKTIVASTFAVLLLSATMASAFDAQGTWTGKLICKFFDGAKGVNKFNSVMKISQNLTNVTIDVDVEFHYSGVTINTTGDTTTGEIVLTDCDAGFDEVGRLSLKGDKIKGKSIYHDTTEGGSCKWVYKRTDLAAPPIGICAG